MAEKFKYLTVYNKYDNFEKKVYSYSYLRINMSMTKKGRTKVRPDLQEREVSQEGR